MKLYIQDIWNKCDITALALFILGLLCRLNECNVSCLCLCV